MQARLYRILIMLGYADDMIIFAGDIARAKEMTDRRGLEMVIVNLKLPDGNGVELIAWLRASNKSLPILAISEEMILDALHAGASGYLLEERDDLEIAISIKSASKGGMPIDPFIMQRILGLVNGVAGDHAASKPEAFDGLPRGLLSERERAILARVAEGMSNREIAETLSISRWTVDTHVRHIYRKLSVNSRTQALRAARLQGLVS